MNEKIKRIMEDAGIYDFVVEAMGIDEEMQKFAELIIYECAAVNEQKSLELLGVITDVENGSNFDNTCMNTLKQVHAGLSSNIQEHFGVGNEV